MIIEQGLMTYLLAQTGITSYVGEQIYYVKADQDATAPYIVVTKVSGVREHSHDGGSHLAHPRFQISVFALKYGTAKTIATAIQTALQGYTGLMGGVSGVTVQAVFYENETDTYEPDTSLFQVITDYIIWHVE